MFLSSRVPEAGFKEAETWRRESGNLFKKSRKGDTNAEGIEKIPGILYKLYQGGGRQPRHTSPFLSLYSPAMTPGLCVPFLKTSTGRRSRSYKGGVEYSVLIGTNICIASEAI